MASSKAAKSVHNLSRAVRLEWMLSPKILVLFFVFTTTTQLVVAFDWPQFLGPGGQGHANADSVRVPLSWNNAEEALWQVDLPGEGWSSPIIAGDRIYLTTATIEGEGLKLHALARSLRTGEPIWKRTLLTKEKLGPAHDKNGHASPTPIYQQGRLYCHFGHYGTVCVDSQNGAVIWKQEALGYDPRHGNGGSPIIVADKLIYSCDGQKNPCVVALDKVTGDVIWRTDRSISTSIAFSTPTLIEVEGKEQLISAAGKAVFAYDPHSGKELWHCRYGNKSVVPKPLYAHGLVYVCTGFNTASLLAIDPRGTGDVTDTHVRWKFGKRIPKESTPIIVGEHLFANDDKGILSCFHARTGNLLWFKRIDGSGGYSASPVYASGHLFFHNAGGVTTVIKPASRFEKVSENHLGQSGLASFAVTSDGFVIRTDEGLIRLQARG